jgi:hypothetical protein
MQLDGIPIVSGNLNQSRKPLLGQKVYNQSNFRV